MVIRYFMGIIKKISNVDSIIWIWKINESSDALSILTDQKTDVKNENKKKPRRAPKCPPRQLC